MPLPDDRIFMASGNHAMIYDRFKNQEQLLPNIPNNIQVNYPFGSGKSFLYLLITYCFIKLDLTTFSFFIFLIFSRSSSSFDA